MIVLLTIAAVIVWQLVGLATVAAFRPEYVGETRDALINVWTWPLAFVMWPVWKLVRARRERDRQRRISAKVASGEYAPDWARQLLNWKG